MQGGVDARAALRDVRGVLCEQISRQGTTSAFADEPTIQQSGTGA